MDALSTPIGRRRLVVAATAIAAFVATGVAGANVPLLKIDEDPYGNASSQHKTVVEPDTFANGSTIVAAAQFGRFYDGGASNIGAARSTNSGQSWSFAFFPGIDGFSNPTGPYSRVTDPSVAYDVKHQVWMVSSIGLNAVVRGVAVIVTRSTNNGLSWLNPVTVKAAGPSDDLDKNWTVCDNLTTSPWFGSCYTVWDDFGHGNALKIAYSRDGGLTWTLSTVPNVGVIGGQPVVQPNGTVIVPLDNESETALGSTRSTNGGVSFSAATTITSISRFTDPGGIRSAALPSAEIDASGKVYVMWSDCRFRAACATNDIVYVTSTDGITWSAVQRVPIDSVGSAVDHFIPGVAVDPATSGATAHVALAYYFFPNKSCTAATCQLDVGYVSSTNGGASWSAVTMLAGPMTMSWLPNTSQGRMVGDYISTSFSGGTAHPVFPVALFPSAGGSDCALATPFCDQALYTPSSGLQAAAGSSVANEPVLVTAKPQPGRSAFKHRH